MIARGEPNIGKTARIADSVRKLNGVGCQDRMAKLVIA